MVTLYRNTTQTFQVPLCRRLSIQVINLEYCRRWGCKPVIYSVGNKCISHSTSLNQLQYCYYKLSWVTFVNASDLDSYNHNPFHKDNRGWSTLETGKHCIFIWFLRRVQAFRTRVPAKSRVPYGKSSMSSFSCLKNFSCLKKSKSYQARRKTVAGKVIAFSPVYVLIDTVDDDTHLAIRLALSHSGSVALKSWPSKLLASSLANFNRVIPV